MASVVSALAVSHSSYMISNPEMVGTAVLDRCLGAFATASDRLISAQPEAVIMLGTDHFNSFSLSNMPQRLIGLSSQYDGWGDNLPMSTCPGAAELGAELMDLLLRSGEQPSFSFDLRLDHSFFGPLHLLVPGMSIPIVPIVHNCIVQPLAPLATYASFGKQLGQAITNATSASRVAILASGGLSHAIGGPLHGTLYPDFDTEFLARFVDCDLAWMQALDDETLEQAGGNGAHEIRNWLTLRSALPSAEAEVLYYEPILPWIVGCAVVELR